MQIPKWFFALATVWLAVGCASQPSRRTDTRQSIRTKPRPNLERTYDWGPLLRRTRWGNIPRTNCSVRLLLCRTRVDPVHWSGGAFCRRALQVKEPEHAACNFDFGAADDLAATEAKPTLMRALPGPEVIQALQQSQFFLRTESARIHRNSPAPDNVRAGQEQTPFPRTSPDRGHDRNAGKLRSLPACRLASRTPRNGKNEWREWLRQPVWAGSAFPSPVKFSTENTAANQRGNRFVPPSISDSDCFSGQAADTFSMLFFVHFWQLDVLVFELPFEGLDERILENVYDRRHDIR